MSYEGYTQLLCAKGHYDSVDCYDDEPKICRFKGCKEKMVWRNRVDVTNGSYEGKKRIDGFVRLKRKSLKTCRCSKCGHEHSLDPTFVIPKKGRIK